MDADVPGLPTTGDGAPEAADPTTDESGDVLHDAVEVPQTGDDAVDAVLHEVAAAAGAPLDEQVAAFDRAHRALQDRLADVDG